MNSVLTKKAGFTLVELLVTVSIIILLGSLVMPKIEDFRKRAETVACSNNLRQIGMAFQLYAQDNDHRAPMVEGMPSNPIYSGDAKAETLLEAFDDYGITQETLKCRGDVAWENRFAEWGSSYQWSPVADDEIITAGSVPIFTRRGQFTRPLSRVTICLDYDNVHYGRANRLYADGHVRQAKK